MTVLNIQNQEFLLSSLIDRCPSSMMLRELVQNAIEAAQGSKDKRIIIGIENEGAPKLKIWNTGRGMDASELRKACDLSSSIRKENSLGENFGMGAKVASLKSNKYGLRYRSCHNGKVFEVTMGMETNKAGQETYQRFDYPDQSLTGTEYPDVGDITEKIRRENKELLNIDWTEVVLFGNREDQNTVTNPFDNDPKVSKVWIANSLYQRFFYLPQGVQISLEDNVATKSEKRKFKTFTDVVSEAGKKYPNDVKHEVVEIEGNVKVHYFFDGPNQSSQHNYTYNYSVANDVPFCGIVFKNEIYDLRRSQKWYGTAPSLGIPFGQKHINIVVELPSNANVLPEQYREELRWDNSFRDQVTIEYFADEIMQNIPEWLKNKIESFSPKSKTSEEVKKQLRDLIKQLSVFDNLTVPNKDGNKKVSHDEDSKKSPSYPDGPLRDEKKQKVPNLNRRRPMSDLDGLIRSNNKELIIDIPNFEVLKNEKDLETHKDLISRAGKYITKTNTIFLNLTYKACTDMRNYLLNEYAFYPDKEMQNNIIQEFNEEFFKIILGKAVVYCLVKRKIDNWSPEHIEDALKSTTLSIVADDWISHIGNFKQKLGSIFKVVKKTA